MSAGEGFSTQGLFDLGNAWLRAGHPGRAILQYERAQALAPHDPAVQQALSNAQSQAGVSVAPESAWMGLVDRLSDDAWAWIALAGLVLLCAGLARLRPGRAGLRARVAVLAGLAGTVLAADAIALRWPEADRAVVVRGTAAHLAPAAGAESSFELREGEVVYLRDRFGNFARVRTADGRSGWVAAADALPVRVTAAAAAAEGGPP